MTNIVALICGVSGQDGAYLADFLLEKGYTVWGTSRDANRTGFDNLERLGIKERVNLISMLPQDFRSVLRAITLSEPTEIYFLAGQSSVGLSFEQPAETIESITLGTLNILEACRLVSKTIKLYHAGSSECFGDTSGFAANEVSPFSPKSPYAVAKASAYWLVRNYREAYSMYACTGILFNHESPLRSQNFVTQKIISVARRIAAGSQETLTLGRLDIKRDWGWAPDYIKAMWLMLQQQKAVDYVVATGKTHSLKEFVEESFTAFGLDWRIHVKQSESLFRPADIFASFGDPSRVTHELGWVAVTQFTDLVKKLVNNELK